MRRRSTASSAVSVPLRHPTPDLQLLQGLHLRNIEKLERSAEEMSQGGSHIGEEIRKMSNGLSRQSSLQSERNGEISVIRPGMTRVSSDRSARSRSNSRNIRNMSGAARWGGYSPNGYITSPVESMSGWSQPALSRVASGSRSSRLAQVSEPLQEGRQLESPLHSPLRESFSMHEHDQSQDSESQYSREVSQSSFAQRYDEIAGQIEHSLENVPPSPPKHSSRALQPLDVRTLLPVLERKCDHRRPRLCLMSY